MPQQPTPDKPGPVEVKMRGLARKHVARHGWPSGEQALNHLVHALQEALPKPRPTEVTQASGTVAGRRGRVRVSAGRGGPSAGPEPQTTVQPATGATEGFGGRR